MHQNWVYRHQRNDKQVRRFRQVHIQNQLRSFGLVSDVRDPGHCPTVTIVAVNEDTLVKNEKGGNSVSEKNKEQLNEDKVDIAIK